MNKEIVSDRADLESLGLREDAGYGSARVVVCHQYDQVTTAVMRFRHPSTPAA
ncbi:MAG: hypothetical protein H5U04_04455 [Firmicutes bacterium]|nr:hypothetical protein [Bacillota bacterium]